MANTMVGRFIAFEGGEGAGKTTQIALLEQSLYEKGIRSLITREPGGTAGGEDIRSLLKKGEQSRWDGLSEALLLYAARHDHAEKLIKPTIEKGLWVLCDRFSDSSFAYQGFGRSLGLERLEQLHHLALGNFFPDLTFIFDISPEESYERVLKRQKRTKNRKDRFDDMHMDFHRRIYEGYREIAEKYKDRCVLVSANTSIDALQKVILDAIEERFGI
jgi:dTMP kinase